MVCRVFIVGRRAAALAGSVVTRSGLSHCPSHAAQTIRCPFLARFTMSARKRVSARTSSTPIRTARRTSSRPPAPHPRKPTSKCVGHRSHGETGSQKGRNHLVAETRQWWRLAAAVGRILGPEEASHVLAQEKEIGRFSAEGGGPHRDRQNRRQGSVSGGGAS